MNRAVVTLVLSLALGSAGLATSTAAAAKVSAPVRITFEKHLVDPATFSFAGTVDGDVTGTLTSTIVPGSLRISGPIWHFDFEWRIVDSELADGDQSFVTVLAAVFNTSTGAVTMNGRVTAGYLTGAQVHEQGQLVDPATFTFAGSLRLMPASA